MICAYSDIRYNIQPHTLLANVKQTVLGLTQQYAGSDEKEIEFTPHRCTGFISHGRSGGLNVIGSPQILVADYHPAFRASMRNSVKQILPNAWVTEVSNYDELLHVIDWQEWAMLLIDLELAGMQSKILLSTVAQKLKQIPSAQCLWICSNPSHQQIQQIQHFGFEYWITRESSIQRYATWIEARIEPSIDRVS